MVHNVQWLTRLTITDASPAVLLIRLYVGLVFASEGTLKFLRPDELGIGRFDKAGIPEPAFFAQLDGVFEIACGVLILARPADPAGRRTHDHQHARSTADHQAAHPVGRRPAVSCRKRLVGLHPRIPRRLGPTVRQRVPIRRRRR